VVDRDDGVDIGGEIQPLAAMRYLPADHLAHAG
jgi:hypothetical protein